MRNIVLLNLSDLHCFEDQRCQGKIFDLFISGLKKFINENPLWKPDFIVIPGDVIDGKDDKDKAYDNATVFIKQVSHLCGLENNDVVVIPGNHDRDCPRDKTADNKNLFEETISVFDKLQKGEKVVVRFCNYQNALFRHYINFASPFCRQDGEDGRFYPARCLKTHGACASTTGYKVFDRFKLVFLLLNTEWLQFPSSFGMTKIKTGSRFVKELINDIRQQYPDHLVVSVMHRPPYQLEWEEKNVDSMSLYNPYHMLINASDMIISGHDHLLSSHNEPGYMANKVQHFQLGAFGCEGEKERDFFLNAASLLKINAVENEVKMVYTHLRSDGADLIWNFDKLTNSYPLRGRYGKKRGNGLSSPDCKFRINDIDIVWVKRNLETIFPVRNEDETDIEQMNQKSIMREILHHHYYGQEYKPLEKPGQFQVGGNYVHICRLKDWEEHKLNITNDETLVHYIVYSLNTEDWQQLEKEKQGFLLSAEMLKNTFSVVIVQNN